MATANICWSSIHRWVSLPLSLPLSLSPLRTWCADAHRNMHVLFGYGMHMILTMLKCWKGRSQRPNGCLSLRLNISMTNRNILYAALLSISSVEWNEPIRFFLIWKSYFWIFDWLPLHNLTPMKRATYRSKVYWPRENLIKQRLLPATEWQKVGQIQKRNDPNGNTRFHMRDKHLDAASISLWQRHTHTHTHCDILIFALKLSNKISHLIVVAPI